jgi:glyceraldehyde 3-phosphate dehydrogenase
MRTVLGCTNAPIVSSDVLGDPRSCVVSLADTMTHRDQVKVYGWYDNEWAYANRLLELTEHIIRAERTPDTRSMAAASPRGATA